MAIFYFQYVSFWCFTDPLFLTILWRLVLKTGSYKYQNEKYLKYKIATNVIFQHVWGPQKNLTPFRPVLILFLAFHVKCLQLCKKPNPIFPGPINYCSLW